jgi:rubredoxin
LIGGSHYKCPGCGYTFDEKEHKLVNVEGDGLKIYSESMAKKGVLTAEAYAQANGIRPGESCRDAGEEAPGSFVDCPSCGKKLSHEHGWKFCGNRNCKLYLNINEIIAPSPGVQPAPGNR